MNFLVPIALLTILLSATTRPVPAAEENADLILEEDFERKELGKGWTIQNGSWTIEDGVLAALELKEDNHAASARRVLVTHDATYQLRFQLEEGTRIFHFGFDPKRGSLDKKGHLFSIVVTPGGWKLLKHLDKNNPKADPNEVLASSDHAFSPGVWHTLRVTTSGTEVTAKIDDLPELAGSHPSFDVPKPTLVFRTAGTGGAKVDDIKVWVPKN